MTSRRRHIGEREAAAIFAREKGICHICGEKIEGGREAWQVEHRIAITLGGDDSKMSPNLGVAHIACHKTKTADDVRANAKGDRMQRRDLGIKRAPRRKIPGSKGTPWRVRLTSSGHRPERRDHDR